MTKTFLFEAQRRDMAKVARKMFERKMTNVAGGNIFQKITATEDIDYGHVKVKKGMTT